MGKSANYTATKIATKSCAAIVTLFTTAFVLTGCSTPTTRLGNESDDHYANSNAAPETYGTDGFTFRKVQSIRPPNDYHFYFKHCSLGDENRDYYSKTSYWCTEP